MRAAISFVALTSSGLAPPANLGQPARGRLLAIQPSSEKSFAVQPCVKNGCFARQATTQGLVSCCTNEAVHDWLANDHSVFKHVFCLA